VKPDRVATSRPVRAELQFGTVHGRTYLGRQRTPHPFHITRPCHLPGDPAGLATLYLQSSSGGLYGDDDLSLSVRLDAQAYLHLTTQAATVVHDAKGGLTQQAVRLEVGPGGFLEYLPDPLILFPGANCHTLVQLKLHEGAKAVIFDSFVAHDPMALGRSFERLSNCVSIGGASGPQLVDRMQASGSLWQRKGLGCVTTVWLVGCSDADQIAEALAPVIASAGTDIYLGIDTLPDRGLVSLRLMAPHGHQMSHILQRIAVAARLALTGWHSAARSK
jgi:urease accessory protein